MSDRIGDIRRRCAAATKGPWIKHDDHGVNGEVVFNSIAPESDPINRIVSTWAEPREDDAEFIAHARSDIPFLLNEIEELEERIEMYKDA